MPLHLGKHTLHLHFLKIGGGMLQSIYNIYQSKIYILINYIEIGEATELMRGNLCYKCQKARRSATVKLFEDSHHCIVVKP